MLHQLSWNFTHTYIHQLPIAHTYPILSLDFHFTKIDYQNYHNSFFHDYLHSTHHGFLNSFSTLLLEKSRLDKIYGYLCHKINENVLKTQDLHGSSIFRKSMELLKIAIMILHNYAMHSDSSLLVHGWQFITYHMKWTDGKQITMWQSEDSNFKGPNSHYIQKFDLQKKTSCHSSSECCGYTWYFWCSSRFFQNANKTIRSVRINPKPSVTTVRANSQTSY